MNSEITSKDFNNLLDRFSSDAEEAGKKYEQIREGLIKYFYYRGCLDPETLADETINRVAAKLSGIRFDEKFVLANYFYSFAANIYLEDCRERKKYVLIENENLEFLGADEGAPEEKNNVLQACMEKCLAGCAPSESSLLMKYYGFGRDERAEQRKILAAKQSISVEFLHTKVSRLRKSLRVCLKKCMIGK